MSQALTESRDAVRRDHERLRKQRLDEFMSGFNVISLRLKEMYQMITLGGDAATGAGSADGPGPGDGLRACGREADLEIVFRNLIDNAVKYSLPAPEVEVTASALPRGKVLVRVADNGPGIPAAERQNVFQRFVRLGSELERSTPGTGLGLFLVHAIVKQLRGRVVAKGRLPQKGTIMEVELPAAP